MEIPTPEFSCFWSTTSSVNNKTIIFTKQTSGGEKGHQSICVLFFLTLRLKALSLNASLHRWELFSFAHLDSAVLAKSITNTKNSKTHTCFIHMIG